MVTHGFFFEFDEHLYGGMLAQDFHQLGQRRDAHMVETVTEAAGLAGSEIVRSQTETGPTISTIISLALRYPSAEGRLP